MTERLTVRNECFEQRVIGPLKLSVLKIDYSTDRTHRDDPSLPRILNKRVKIRTIRKNGLEVHNPDLIGEPFDHSPLDSCRKFSEQLDSCIGLLLTGQRKDSNELVTQLFHISPLAVYEKSNENFRYLAELFDEFREITKPENRILIVGGGFYFPDNYRNTKDRYQELQKLISDLSTHIPKAESITLPPRTEVGNCHFYYDNQERELIIIATSRANAYAGAS